MVLLWEASPEKPAEMEKTVPIPAIPPGNLSLSDDSIPRILKFIYENDTYISLRLVL